MDRRDRRGNSRFLPLLGGAVLLSLLAILATLQYRWIGQGSLLESQRLRSALEEAASGFEADLDREVTRAFFSFVLPPAASAEDLAGRLAHQLAGWQAGARFPRLIRDVWRVQPRSPQGPLLEALRLDPPRLVEVPWPPDLEGFRRRVAGAGSSPFAPPIVAADLPGLAIPVLERHETLDLPAEKRVLLQRGADCLLIRFDSATIAQQILPELARRRLGSDQGGPFAVEVTDRRDPARVIFRSDPRLPAHAFRAADLTMPLFGVRHFDDLENLEAAGMPPPAVMTPGAPMAPRAAPPGAALALAHGLWMHRIGPGPGPRPGGGGPWLDAAWQLAITRRDGPLAETVSAHRRHNLAISAGIMALLAIATAMMVAAAQRARRLARQQLEFVANVSHELHTPLAAIRSAGENLADGVVVEPAQVKRYGELIANEGRRLSGMIGQVLAFAGIQSGRQAYRLQTIPVAPVVDGALEDCRGLLEERQARVERDVAPQLPPIQGDPAALRQALRNLIENAAKYGGPDPWIGVRARPAGGGGVEITVEDRGIGVDRDDLPHLFEPFFRGRRAAASSIAGSGLGLSVVRHIMAGHRGRVSFASAASGRGTAFTLHLQAAAE